jgi:hypothetical protein
MSDKEVILEEYRNVRSEISQLNSQVFTAITISVGANVTILGWMFSKDEPSKYLFLPLAGVLILFGACILVLVQVKLAHRLALFQKYSIENRLPDICWARVYFQYIKEYRPPFIERLAGSSILVLAIIQIGNILIFLFLPLFEYGFSSVKIDRMNTFFFVVMVIAMLIECYLYKKLTDYKDVEQAMEKIASKMHCSKNTDKPQQ